MASSAGAHETWTTSMGAPATSASRIARFVASASTGSGRVRAWNRGAVSPRESAAGLLQGEVDDHGRTARRSGLRARCPVVRRYRAPERHVHVGVRVYKARHHELARGVYRLGAVRVKVRGDGDYLLVLDEHVGPVAAFCGYDHSPAEE